MKQEALLQIANCSIAFGGLRALQDVSLTTAQGQILGLVGPNGAGKTTLLNVIAGAILPKEGELLFCGHSLNRLRPHQRVKLGVARTFQIPKPFLTMTVLENVAVGVMFGSSGKAPARKQALAQAAGIVAKVGLGAFPGKLASELNLAQRKRLELARALASAPKLLLLDEVGAGLNFKELDQLLDLITALRANDGVSIIMVEHIMKAVMQVSDEVAVLKAGRLIAKDKPARIVKNEEVIRAYLGAKYGSAGGGSE